MPEGRFSSDTVPLAKEESLEDEASLSLDIYLIIPVIMEAGLGTLS